MHYAIVTETYPPEANGVALTVHSLQNGLRARGCTVSMVRPRRSADPPAAPHEMLVASMPLPGYAGLRAGLPCTRALLTRWRRHRPDAIYIATEGPLGWSAMRAAKRLAIPVATGLHTRFDTYMHDYGHAGLAPLALQWMRRFHNAGQSTLVPTRELAAFLQANGFARVRQLARGVDCRLFDPARRCDALRRDWQATADTPVVIHVGRIAAEKNLGLAVRAFRALQRHRPDARCVWVGDGPLRGAMAAENPDFLFLGTQHGETLARMFASADLFAFPSLSETFGNVTLEAMASGVPTVAFDYGAAREHLRDGLHGAAIPRQDDAGFIDAVVRIGGDAGARETMARQARVAMLPLSPDRVAADLDILLARLTATEDANARMAAA